MKRTVLTLFALLLPLATIHAAKPPTQNPNILVILADDLGYGELGCQGFTTQISTPNIDSIAKNGIRFTSGYVSGPYCSPTRAGFMTGRYQQRFGHEFNIQGSGPKGTPFGLSLQEKTIGDRLKAAGYMTGWFGKSHLGFLPQYHPLKRGFDEFYGFLAAQHSYVPGGGRGDTTILRGTEPIQFTHTTDDFGREAVSFIERHQAKPWFVYLAFNAVHGPMESTQKYLSRFTSIESPKRQTFAAMLSAMDDNVGLVLAKLRELGQEENTLIFFFSDNGGPTPQSTASNGPLRGYKSQTWEGGIRIPFMVQWKGRLPAGKVDDRPIIQLDILPTALAVAGVEPKPEWKLDGVNLLPYLTGEKTGSPHDALYWRFGWQYALRMGDWKIVKATTGKDFPGGMPGDHPDLSQAELYNLARDIGEKNNLAAAEPEKLKELVAVYSKWNSELIEPKWYHPLPGARKANKKQQAGD